MEGERKGIAKVTKINGLRGAEDLGQAVASKVPEVTVGFWLVKILATTLGETGGEVVSLFLDLGYTMGSVLFLEVFAAAVAAQVAVGSFHPLLFWFVIIATASASTTLAELVDHALGIGWAGGAGLLLALLVASFTLWYRVTGSVSVRRVALPAAELFFWMTVLLSQMLGTALGGWMAEGAGLGFRGGAVVVVGGLALLLFLYARTGAPRIVLFWCAFVLTRPFGTMLADWLDNPVADGGLDLDRLPVSALLLAAILVCIVHLPQRPAR
ncbi:MAG: hypothetical protein P4M07_13525 [Xanthobacteraceae bacterium]|nr:hypothetical protein [Xanthobacteraceae bacterium]